MYQDVDECAAFEKRAAVCQPVADNPQTKNKKNYQPSVSTTLTSLVGGNGNGKVNKVLITSGCLLQGRHVAFDDTHVLRSKGSKWSSINRRTPAVWTVRLRHSTKLRLLCIFWDLPCQARDLRTAQYSFDTSFPDQEMTKLIASAQSNACAYEKRSEYCEPNQGRADLDAATRLNPLRTYPYRYRAAVLMDTLREGEAVEELSRAISFKVGHSLQKGPLWIGNAHVWKLNRGLS